MRMKNVKNGVMRVMLWDHSAFVLKQVLEHVSRGGGGVEGHSRIWLIQVRYVLLNTRS